MSRKSVKEIFELSKSIDLLNKIQSVKSGFISSKDFKKDFKINLLPIDKGLKFELYHDEYIFQHDKWEFKDLEIKQNDINLKIPLLSVEKKTGGQTKGKIYAFEYGKFNNENKKYHRLVLPLKKAVNFAFSIENINIEYNLEKGFYSRVATEIEIDDSNFYLFETREKRKNLTDKHYLILESKTKMKYSQFSDFCFSILISFGFVSGDFVNDDGYFIQYSNMKMDIPKAVFYTQMRGSIKCLNVPTYSNPYGYIHNNEIADLYKDKVRTISLKEFSILCQKSHTDIDFRSILLLLIEANTQSLLSSPGIISIALETISNIIYKENEPKLAPIKSKTISRKVRKQLLKELDNFKGDIDEEGFEIIKTRINQINQRTNRDKLLKPFEILNIPINESDIEAIEQRNAFLHGRTPKVQGIEPKTIAESDKISYYLVSARKPLIFRKKSQNIIYYYAQIINR